MTSLPEDRFYHTQHGDKLCGGGGWRSNTTKTCIQWKQAEEQWNVSNTLRVPRIDHVSWTTENGTYLIGGSGQEGQDLTTELVKEDGTTDDGFSLKYRTRYIDKCILFHKNARGHLIFKCLNQCHSFGCYCTCYS